MIRREWLASVLVMLGLGRLFPAILQGPATEHVVSPLTQLTLDYLQPLECNLLDIPVPVLLEWMKDGEVEP